MSTTLWAIAALLGILLLVGSYGAARRRAARKRHGKDRSYFNG